MKELLKQAYERHGAQLMAVCRRYTPDQQTAQDMFHDGFMTAFKAARSFRGRTEAELYAWLRTIMVNTCLMRLRRRDLLRESVEIEGAGEVMEEDLELDGIDEETLLRLISSLPDGERAVFNLFVFEELSHKEIAARLGISERASISKMYRARAELAAKIKEYGK